MLTTVLNSVIWNFHIIKNESSSYDLLSRNLIYYHLGVSTGVAATCSLQYTTALYEISEELVNETSIVYFINAASISNENENPYDIDAIWLQPCSLV